MHNKGPTHSTKAIIVKQLWEAEINSERCVKGAEFQIEILPGKI
jgi:hypothetical protein